jgi:hypothetical protein
MSEIDPKSGIKAATERMYELLQAASTKVVITNQQLNAMFDICNEIIDHTNQLEKYENHLALQLIHIHLRELVKRDPTLTNFIVEINLKAPGRTPAMLKLDLYP